MKSVLLVIIGFALLLALLWVIENKRTLSAVTRHRPIGETLKVNGHELHFKCTGNQREPLVLFEAGAGGSLRIWDEVVDRLGSTVHLCRYDRAGLGWSGQAKTPRDLDGLTDDLEALLDHLGPEGPILLVGHSFGGLLVQAIARKHPERVVGLVLVDSLETEFARSHAMASQLYLGILRAGAALSPFGLPRLLGLAQTPSGTPLELEPVLLAEAYEASTLTTIADEAAVLAKTLVQFDQLPALSRDLPITIISRKPKDEKLEKKWAEAQSRLGQLSKNSTHIQSASENHFLQFADPDVIVRAIQDILTSRKK